jgi:diguanylate cyclase (GGDEF)-like protein
MLIYLAQTMLDAGYLRSALVLMNIFIPYALTLKKCNQQFKMHRVGDRILYGSLLLTLLIFVAYIVIYTLFYSHEKQVPLSLYFIALLSFICILFFGFALSIIYSLVGKLRKEIITDKLTGAKNRNYLNDVAQQMYSLAKRRDEPLSIILCDIDWFKSINDTYGHLAGDKVLINFSSAIESSLRTEDILIRIGGEEFIILLPYNNIEKAMFTAERLRTAINEKEMDVGKKTINISASFGVVQVDIAKSIDENINHADIALYEAKRSGRNKVVAYSR